MIDIAQDNDKSAKRIHTFKSGGILFNYVYELLFDVDQYLACKHLVFAIEEA